MPITRQFCKTVLSRAENDTEFRQHLLIEAVNELLTGDLQAGAMPRVGCMIPDFVSRIFIRFPCTESNA
jgi:hypothetical protein